MSGMLSRAGAMGSAHAVKALNDDVDVVATRLPAASVVTRIAERLGLDPVTA